MPLLQFFKFGVLLADEPCGKIAIPEITWRYGQNMVLHILEKVRGLGRSIKVAILPLREDNFLGGEFIALDQGNFPFWSIYSLWFNPASN